jgi:hypothetical protein
MLTMSDENVEKPNRVRFDPTVNLGHILTFVGFLLAGLGAWTMLDKRIVVLEVAQRTQSIIDASQNDRFETVNNQVRDLLLRLDRQVERLNDRLDRSPSIGNGVKLNP